MERILGWIRDGRAIWIGSAALEVEVQRNPDPDRRRDTGALLAHAGEVVVPGPAEAARAELLEKLGFTAFDALHLACAETSGADAFLTTDDALVRRARQHAKVLRVRVENPLSWWKDAIQ